MKARSFNLIAAAVIAADQWFICIRRLHNCLNVLRTHVESGCIFIGPLNRGHGIEDSGTQGQKLSGMASQSKHENKSTPWSLDSQQPMTAGQPKSER